MGSGQQGESSLLRRDISLIGVISLFKESFILKKNGSEVAKIRSPITVFTTNTVSGEAKAKSHWSLVTSACWEQVIRAARL
jgi:hypothetical protein